MAASFVVYIDEAGCDGFRFGAGSSDWFMISAIVVRKENDGAMVQKVDAVRKRLGFYGRFPLHFARLSHEQRLTLLTAFPDMGLRTVTIFIYKPHLESPETFTEPHRLYFYTVRYLLERVSWLCRDRRKSGDLGDGSAEIVMSNRGEMPYEDLRQYLDNLSRDQSIQIERGIIRPNQLQTERASKSAGLMLADAVSSGYFRACEPASGLVDEYAVRLMPVVYRHRGKEALRYGIKFFPGTAPMPRWVAAYGPAKG